MNSVVLLLGAVIAFVVAYKVYGDFLAKKWGISNDKVTPATKINDDKDDYRDILFHKERFTETYRYMFLGIGDHDFRMIQGDIEAMRLLREEYGLPIDFYHVPGIHDWTFWRKALVRFMGKVFH